MIAPAVAPLLTPPLELVLVEPFVFATHFVWLQVLQSLRDQMNAVLNAKSRRVTCLSRNNPHWRHSCKGEDQDMKYSFDVRVGSRYASDGTENKN